MKALSALAITAIGVLAQSTSAFNPSSDRSRCTSNLLCLTSFIWCSDQGDCSYPDNVYPPLNPSLRLTDAAGILDNVTYEITWEHADPGYPIQLEWLIPQGNLYPGNSSTFRWSQNLTAGSTSTTLNFPAIASTFPAQGFNNTPDNILVQAASGINVLRLTQPERPDQQASGSPVVWVDSSQAFVVLPARAAEFIDAAVDSQASQERKWRLGVGIGVGLGVPLLMALAFFGGSMFGKKRTNNQDVTGAKKVSTSS